MSQKKRQNHYVPRLYLKQWSKDGLQICAYRILVSHENVPKWGFRSISETAFITDLYTEIEDEEEVDRFEKWLDSEFENPGQESINKVLKDNPLSPRDWERLVGLLGSQDLRTPSNYIESVAQWEETLPNMLQSTLEKSVRKLEQKGKSTAVNSLPKDTGLLDNIFEVEAVPSGESETGQGYIKAEITVGRKLWLQGQKHLLTKTIAVLKSHKWCIVRPAHGRHWFTSDHPVVKLNYYGQGNYDLKGGWGKKGGNIFMPISPRHLLFTEIGKDLPDRLTFTSEQTKLFQHLIAERAWRWIFSHEPLAIISKLRPRHVDPDAVKYEKEQWENWHKHQKQAEQKKPTDQS